MGAIGGRIRLMSLCHLGRRCDRGPPTRAGRARSPSPLGLVAPVHPRVVGVWIHQLCVNTARGFGPWCVIDPSRPDFSGTLDLLRSIVVTPLALGPEVATRRLFEVLAERDLWFPLTASRRSVLGAIPELVWQEFLGGFENLK